MLAAVAAFVLLLIAALAIPVSLTFRVSSQRAIRNEIMLYWAFGLVSVRIPSMQTEKASRQRADSNQTAGRLERSPRRKPNVFAIIGDKRIRRRIFRFISDLWHAVHKQDLSLRVRIGLGDPADTGQLWGAVGPLAGLFANIKEVSVSIEPDFLDTTFAWDGRGRIRLIPLRVAYLLAAVFLSPSIWRGIRRIRMAA